LLTEDKIMNLNRYKFHPISSDRYAHARDKILHHLLWNILPVTVMLVLFGWVSLQAGKMIDASKPSSKVAVGLVE
jgi:hypothetical protein